MKKELTEHIYEQIKEIEQKFKDVNLMNQELTKHTCEQREEEEKKEQLKIHILHKKIGKGNCGYRRFLPINDIDTDNPQSQSDCSTCERVERNQTNKEKESEVINTCYTKENERTEKAQLILWREVSETSKERTFFRVSMVGTSSIATLGLTTLFVGKEQKQDLFLSQEWENQNLLCELQKKTRCEFMKNFRDRLKNEMETLLKEEIDDKQEREVQRKNRYIDLVLYTVTCYLDTVLYRYFLPFLSEKDIHRIYNGMKTLINTMKANNESPFCLKYPKDGDPDHKEEIKDETVKKIVNVIPKILEEVLRSFRGLEVFYKVKISHSLEKQEDSDIPKKYNKGILDVKMLEEANDINYFFL